MTVGRENTKEEIKYTLEVLEESVESLREISPLKGETKR
jgi:cysteine sulfinate desulfinase/cysteine desulfurase-like protein